MHVHSLPCWVSIPPSHPRGPRIPHVARSLRDPAAAEAVLAADAAWCQRRKEEKARRAAQEEEGERRARVEAELGGGQEGGAELGGAAGAADNGSQVEQVKQSA